MLFSQFNNAECEEIHNQVDAYEETAPTTLIEGADNFLHQLHLFGLNLGLVTSSWHGKIDQVLKQHNINVFSKIICRTDMRQGKPHPEGYLMALQHFNIKPQQALAFEDSEGGLKAVVAAQIKPVKVSIGVKAHNDAILTIGSYHQFSFEKGRPVATLQGSRAMQLYLV
jgi:HAD superfamily hydrolase (TIGR01509 family)